MKKFEKVCKGAIVVGVIGIAVCTVMMKRGAKIFVHGRWYTTNQKGGLTK